MHYWAKQSEKKADTGASWGVAWNGGCVDDISDSAKVAEAMAALLNQEQVEPCHVYNIVEDLLAQGAWNWLQFQNGVF